MEKENNRKKLKTHVDVLSSENLCSLCAANPTKLDTLTGSKICDEVLEIENKLANELLSLNYGPKVEYIYNPIVYAKSIHENFTKKFCNSEKYILIIGMNPGPWGMCQTGVPFGEVNYVKNWLKLEGVVQKPIKEHRNRPVLGLDCKRKEISGDRLWSLFEEISCNPESLFCHSFLTNYCPLAYLATSGKNITPVDLKVKERKPLESACNEALLNTIKLLNIKYVLCIGNYVTQQATKVLKTAPELDSVKVVTLMHPSPANPTANKGWREIALQQLTDSKLLKYFNCQKSP